MLVLIERIPWAKYAASSLFGVGNGLGPWGKAAQPFPSVERTVANRAGEVSLCQRRQPPEAVAEGQRLQRLTSPATIGHRVGWADHPGYDSDCLRRGAHTKVAGGNKPPPTLNSEEPETYRRRPCCTDRSFGGEGWRV